MFSCSKVIGTVLQGWAGVQVDLDASELLQAVGGDVGAVPGSAGEIILMLKLLRLH